MENKAHALAAGAFVIGLIGLLIALVMWFTRDQTVRHIYELSTSDAVSGLQPQAMVRYRGVAVGRVVEIDFDPQQKGNVRLRISVDQRVPLSESSYAMLSYQGVTGLASIALDDDGPSQKPLQPNSDQPPRIPLKPSTLAKLQDKSEVILQQVESASARVNALLDADNQKRIASALENMAQASASSNRLIQSLERTVQNGLNPTLAAMPETLLRVKTAANDVSRTAQNLNSSVNRLNAPEGALDRLGQGMETLSSSTLPRINQVADEASRTLRRLGHTASTLNDQPQSLLFGSGAAEVGPGEPGFRATVRPTP